MNEIANVDPVKFRQPKLVTETDRQFFRRHVLLVALLAFWLAANVLINLFILISHSNSMFGSLVFGSAGLIFSQFAVFAVLFALFPAGLLFRTLLTTIATMASFLAIVMGEMIFGYWEVTSEFYWQALPLLFLGLASPFLLARSVLGWQIRFDWLGEAEPEPLSVAGLMGATAIVAFAIFMIQLLEQQHLLLSLRYVLIGTGVSFMVLFPVASQILKTHSPLTSLTFLGVGVVLLSILSLVFVQIPLRVLMGWPLTTLTFLMSFAIALVAIRSVGGRLVTNRSESQA